MDAAEGTSTAYLQRDNEGEEETEAEAKRRRTEEGGASWFTAAGGDPGEWMVVDEAGGEDRQAAGEDDRHEAQEGGFARVVWSGTIRIRMSGVNPQECAEETQGEPSTMILGRAGVGSIAMNRAASMQYTGHGEAGNVVPPGEAEGMEHDGADREERVRQDLPAPVQVPPRGKLEREIQQGKWRMGRDRKGKRSNFSGTLADSASRGRPASAPPPEGFWKRASQRPESGAQQPEETQAHPDRAASPLSVRGPVPSIGSAWQDTQRRYATAGRTTYSGEIPPAAPSAVPPETIPSGTLSPPPLPPPWTTSSSLKDRAQSALSLLTAASLIGKSTASDTCGAVVVKEFVIEDQGWAPWKIAAVGIMTIVGAGVVCGCLLASRCSKEKKDEEKKPKVIEVDFPKDLLTVEGLKFAIKEGEDNGLPFSSCRGSLKHDLVKRLEEAEDHVKVILQLRRRKPR